MASDPTSQAAVRAFTQAMTDLFAAASATAAGNYGDSAISIAVPAHLISICLGVSALILLVAKCN